jgi:hypothetical protein
LCAQLCVGVVRDFRIGCCDAGLPVRQAQGGASPQKSSHRVAIPTLRRGSVRSQPGQPLLFGYDLLNISSAGFAAMTPAAAQGSMPNAPA